MLQKTKNIFKNIWQDESGQGATEYILMIVVVVAIVFAFKKQITEIISSKTQALKGDLDMITPE